MFTQFTVIVRLRSCVCVKVKGAVLGSPSLISIMVSVDVKHHVYLVYFAWKGGGGGYKYNSFATRAHSETDTIDRFSD